MVLGGREHLMLEVSIMVPVTPGSPIRIGQVVLLGSTVVLEVEGSRDTARCPMCHTLTQQVHDRYQRRPLDLPWRGSVVRLHLMVRRFRCPNRACPRATFAEDFGPALPRFARRTTDATALLLQVACATGGEGGARLAKRIGLPTSPDTLLRLLRQLPEPDRPTPTVLGVDDLSLRRGRSYATLLVDLVTHQRVDLLQGREAAVLAEWLTRHPGVTTIVRDRSEAYAEGAKTGAPLARQVADRFHLVQNAGAALDDLLKQRRRIIDCNPEGPSVNSTAAKPLSPSQQRQAEQRASRIARWEQVRALRATGMSLRGIAKVVSLDRKTVRSLLATPEPPRNRQRYPRPTDLTSPTLRPYVSYLQDRWQQGCHNISQLYREIVTQGYSGSRSLLAQALAPWRPPRAPPANRRRTRRSLRWLCLRPSADLNPEEQAALEQVLAEDAELASGYALLQRFRALVATRDLAALGRWLADALTSSLPSFVALANGITADRSAVEGALTMPWPNGQTEGQVQRLKLIKRQMYGRAKFDLLRRRVLAA